MRSRRLLFSVSIGALALAAASLMEVQGAGATTKVNLSSKLLSISQMPTGWSVDNSSGGSGVGCLNNILEPGGIKQTANASVYFEASGSVPAVGEKLATFANPKGAYRKIVSDLAACTHVSGTVSGQKVTGTLGQMSFPRYGAASEAFAITLTVQGTSLAEDLLIVREDNIVMGIDEGDLPPVETSQFRGFVKKALAELG